MSRQRQTPKRMYKRWGRSDYERVAEMHLAGATVRDIAKEYNLGYKRAWALVDMVKNDRSLVPPEWPREQIVACFDHWLRGVLCLPR